jgi:hypothetical protein
MKNKQLSVHRIFAIVHFSLALVSAFPTGTASKISLLGYNALCSFTPISTAILISLALLHLYLHKKRSVVSVSV